PLGDQEANLALHDDKSTPNPNVEAAGVSSAAFGAARAASPSTTSAAWANWITSSVLVGSTSRQLAVRRSDTSPTSASPASGGMSAGHTWANSSSSRISRRKWRKTMPSCLTRSRDCTYLLKLPPYRNSSPAAHTDCVCTSVTSGKSASNKSRSLSDSD